MSQKQDIFTVCGGKVKFHRGGYNPTSDAVWLAAFAKPARTVLDVGIGSGGVALCFMAHNPSSKVTGIDISEKMLQECAKNAKLNGHSIELLTADILNWKTSRTFDLVISNPPYFKGTPSNHGAHHNADLHEWTKKCIARVRPRGYFCTVVDGSAVGDVITAIGRSCGEITIFPLFGSKNTAERVLIMTRLGVTGGGQVYSGMSMNNNLILRDGLTIWNALAKLQDKCSIS